MNKQQIKVKESSLTFLRKEWGIAVFTNGFTDLTDEACELMSKYKECNDFIEATKMMDIIIRKIRQAHVISKAAEPERFKEMCNDLRD